MGDRLRMFELVNDEIYKWEGLDLQLRAGDTFTGGWNCQYPAARDYATVRYNLRIWFSQRDVEGNPERFRELFT